LNKKLIPKGKTLDDLVIEAILCAANPLNTTSFRQISLDFLCGLVSEKWTILKYEDRTRIVLSLPVFDMICMVYKKHGIVQAANDLVTFGNVDRGLAEQYLDKGFFAPPN
jgi:hypothetical protein